MLYARSDIRAFNPSSPDCLGHTEPADTESEHALTGLTHFSIDCPVCEPELAGDPLWAPRLRDVPLTADEEDSAEQQQRRTEGDMAQFARALFEQIRANGATELPPAVSAAPPVPAKQPAARKPAAAKTRA